MATESEIYKIIVKVENEAEIARLKAEVDKAEESIRRLNADLKAGAISQAQYAAAAKQAAVGIASAKHSIQDLQGATRNMGQAALEASRGFEDLQYGVAGVLNNIPSLVTSLGGTAGLAGALSAAAVAGKILYDHWDQLAVAFGLGSTKTEAERMEELGNKTAKTAEETAKLAEYEERRKNIAAQRAPTEESESRTRDINKSINEGPELDFRNAVDQLRGTQVTAMMDSKFDDELKRAKGELAKLDGRNDTVANKLRVPLSKDVKDAQVARDAAYNEARDKYINDLTTRKDKQGNRYAMDKFLDDAQKSGTFGTAAMRRIREAADPSIESTRRDLDEDAAGFADRDLRMAQAKEDYLKEQTARFTGNASPEARRIALGGIAGGNGIDKDALSKAFEGDMRGAGIDPEVIGELAERVAEAFAEATAKKVKEEAAKNGITDERAAQGGLVGLNMEQMQVQQSMLQAALQSIKKVPDAKVQGYDEFAQSLLAIKPAGEKDLIQKQIDELQRQTAIQQGMRLALERGVFARMR